MGADAFFVMLGNELRKVFREDFHALRHTLLPQLRRILLVAVQQDAKMRADHEQGGEGSAGSFCFSHTSARNEQLFL